MSAVDVRRAYRPKDLLRSVLEGKHRAKPSRSCRISLFLWAQCNNSRLNDQAFLFISDLSFGIRWQYATFREASARKSTWNKTSEGLKREDGTIPCRNYRYWLMSVCYFRYCYIRKQCGFKTVEGKLRAFFDDLKSPVCHSVSSVPRLLFKLLKHLEQVQLNSPWSKTQSLHQSDTSPTFCHGFIQRRCRLWTCCGGQIPASQLYYVVFPCCLQRSGFTAEWHSQCCVIRTQIIRWKQKCWTWEKCTIVTVRTRSSSGATRVFVDRTNTTVYVERNQSIKPKISFKSILVR